MVWLHFCPPDRSITANQYKLPLTDCCYPLMKHPNGRGLFEDDSAPGHRAWGLTERCDEHKNDAAHHDDVLAFIVTRSQPNLSNIIIKTPMKGIYFGRIVFEVLTSGGNFLMAGIGFTLMLCWFFLSFVTHVQYVYYVLIYFCICIACTKPFYGGKYL